jgi:hypothetical protein
VNKQQSDLFIAGYDDRVRNAIPHGETVFRGEGVIQYGRDIANYSLAPFEFLSRYDQLCRTSNGLVIALLLFWREMKTIYGITPISGCPSQSLFF